jgi:hypothetical protein
MRAVFVYYFMPSIRNYLLNFIKLDRFKNNYWILIFAVYLVLLAAVVARHEPWMDEAQAWLLAKDASLTELFVTYLRYEGSPGLWHLILSIPAKLNFPYFTINVLAAIFSALAVWLFLRYSPFPPLVKILFPFSYFILFQYAAVARNYCLVAPLLFLIAINFKSRLEKPIVFSLLLCLLANVSTHTFLIAGAFLAVHLLDVVKAWKELDKRAKIGQIITFLMFGAVSVLIVLMLFPASDHFLGNVNNWSVTNFLYVTRWSVSSALLFDESSGFRWLQVWLSLAVFFITIFWLIRKRLALWYLFPQFLILALFSVRYWNLWHVGIVFFLWIFALWISFDKDKTEISAPSVPSKIMLALLAIVLATQIYWAFYAVRSDFRQNYSGSKEIAEYIKENNLENRKIFVSGWKSAAIHPYFDKNIFYNYNEGAEKRFWIWTMANQTPLGADEQIFASIENEKPDVLIFAADHLDVNLIKEIKGYRYERAFEGYLYWKTGFHELNYYWLFRRNETQPAP